ncbi:hypothetical protein [Sulfurisphaera ohwakuensis]|uniref:hypothetical protein n=1 Tax=Sulfurisphaera ohwakuensis TaxID=69656 RepID=UPI0036F359F9
MKLKIVPPPSPYKGKRYAVVSKKNAEYLGDYARIITKTREIVLKVGVSNKIDDNEIGISRLFISGEDEAEVEPKKIEESREVVIKTPLRIDGLEDYIRKILFQQPIYEGEKIFIPFIHGKIEIEIKKVDNQLGFIGKSTLIILV